MDGVFDIAIIGGGIAGVSLAYELAGDARVVLIEQEDQPGYHASGRSAAILAHNYGSRTIRALTAASLPAFTAPPAGFASAPLLSPRGLIRIATPDQITGLRALYADMATTTALRWVEPDEMETRVPLLRPGRVAGGFANDAAADIDVHAMMQGYLRGAKANGAEIKTSAQTTELARSGGKWRIKLKDGSQLTAATIVNAAGAWADEVAAMAGIAPLGLTPKRRSAVTFDAPSGFDVGSLPMVVDADERFYLKPEGGRLMASPGDETPSPPCDSRPEEIDIAICLDRIGTAFTIDQPRPVSTWSGLRTFSPDGEPVCGWDPDQPGFFWLAGQGGSGVQTAPALARLSADALLNRERPGRQAIPDLPVGALSPARFNKIKQKQI